MLEILNLMVKGIYEIICQEHIIKSRVYNYCDDLVIVDLKTKSIIIDDKSYKDLVIYLLGMFLKDQ